MRRSLLWFLLLHPLAQASAQGGGAPLRLDEAIRRARQGAFANRGARAGADAQRATAGAALRGILPAVRVDAGYMRTTDPIGAFGTTLRQRTISQQDFDPARLNFPAVTPNYTGGLVLEQPLFNADAWTGRRAALRAADAADASAHWTEVGTTVDVIKAWFGATVAAEKVTTLRAALRAAREHVRQAESMARNGMVTPSDAMLAAVKAGEVEVQLIEAEGEAANARLGLATAIGAPADTSFGLPETLPATAVVRSLAREVRDLAARERSDARAATAAHEAATSDARRARALLLPRVNSFARYDWNSSLRPFGGDNNWTVGVMASWSPFAGASELTELRTTASRVAAADAMREGALARAQLEAAQSRRMLDVALARLDIAERSVHQATDAHRIVARKYDGGLAAVVELLDAAAIETQARLGLTAARYSAILAATERYRALGHDPASVAVLDSHPAVPTDPSHD